MSLKDYLDLDVSYLLGLIVGRGTMECDEDTFRLVLPFRFVKPELEGMDQFSGFLASVATKVMPRLQSLLGTNIRINVSERREEITLIISLPREMMIVRNLLMILTGNPVAMPPNYRDYRIPEIILNADTELQKEFIRGFADISGNIRRSNADQRGFHRVYLDVLNENWILPVQICRLLQDHLKVSVSNILWGHPNLRDPQAKQEKVGLREHQIRVYAHDFVEVGFYIEHKNEALKRLAGENRGLIAGGRSNPSRKCPGYGKLRRKSAHPMENSEVLPEHLRRHFDAYWEICAEMGCPYAKNAPKLVPLELREEEDEES